MFLQMGHRNPLVPINRPTVCRVLQPLPTRSVRRAGGFFQAQQESADRGDRKLLADLVRQPIVDLRMTRDRSFRTVGWIGIDRMASALSFQSAPLMLQVRDKFMPLQTQDAPTWTESGTSSMRSASEVAPGSGVGKGLPSSRRH